MLKIKVIADNILNLTDARYFAAFGVDYLVFNLDNIHQDAIKEIKNWVEGVKVLLHTSKTLTPEMLDFILALSPTGFIVSDTDLLDELIKQLPDAEYFLKNTEGKVVQYSQDDIPLQPFIKVGNVKELEQTLMTNDLGGIIVEGEQEEKVGFKNFDQLDDIFELLAD